ncbi:hypothetical protein FB451DRAFT_64264 [Mycena latifolia]|nr:hypothetical protein FB451DRAFT_64264 [Mycena latifolia]
MLSKVLALGLAALTLVRAACRRPWFRAVLTSARLLVLPSLSLSIESGMVFLSQERGIPSQRRRQYNIYVSSVMERHGNDWDWKVRRAFEADQYTIAYSALAAYFRQLQGRSLYWCCRRRRLGPAFYHPTCRR